jgi:hypothetical protein
MKVLIRQFQINLLLFIFISFPLVSIGKTPIDIKGEVIMFINPNNCFSCNQLKFKHLANLVSKNDFKVIINTEDSTSLKDYISKSFRNCIYEIKQINNKQISYFDNLSLNLRNKKYRFNSVNSLIDYLSRTIDTLKYTDSNAYVRNYYNNANKSVLYDNLKQIITYKSNDSINLIYYRKIINEDQWSELINNGDTTSFSPNLVFSGVTSNNLYFISKGLYLDSLTKNNKKVYRLNHKTEFYALSLDSISNKSIKKFESSKTDFGFAGVVSIDSNEIILNGYNKKLANDIIIANNIYGFKDNELSLLVEAKEFGLEKLINQVEDFKYGSKKIYYMNHKDSILYVFDIINKTNAKFPIHFNNYNVIGSLIYDVYNFKNKQYMDVYTVNENGNIELVQTGIFMNNDFKSFLNINHCFYENQLCFLDNNSKVKFIKSIYNK